MKGKGEGHSSPFFPSRWSWSRRAGGRRERESRFCPCPVSECSEAKPSCSLACDVVCAVVVVDVVVCVSGREFRGWLCYAAAASAQPRQTKVTDTSRHSSLQHPPPVPLHLIATLHLPLSWCFRKREKEKKTSTGIFQIGQFQCSPRNNQNDRQANKRTRKQNKIQKITVIRQNWKQGGTLPPARKHAAIVKK